MRLSRKALTVADGGTDSRAIHRPTPGAWDRCTAKIFPWFYLRSGRYKNNDPSLTEV